MPNYEYIRTDNFLDLPTTATIMTNEQHQPKSMNDEYNEIRKECIQRSFKSTQSSSIKTSSGGSSSSTTGTTNLQSQKSMGSSNNNATQRKRRSIDDNITNNSSRSTNNNNNRLNKHNHRRHSISNNTSINNSSFVNSSQISNILQEHLLHSPTPGLDDSNDTNQQHKQQSSAVYNRKTAPQTVHDAINLELQHRNDRRDGNTTQNRKSRDSSTSPLPPTSELQRHLQRDSTTSNQSSVVSQRRGGSRRSTSSGGSLRDSNATILHSNQKRRNHHNQGGGLRDSSATILHSNQQKETQNCSQLGNSGSRSGRPQKELVDSLQYSLDDSGKCNISLF